MTDIRTFGNEYDRLKTWGSDGRQMIKVHLEMNMTHQRPGAVM